MSYDTNLPQPIADNIADKMISPACILSFVLTATVRGELVDAWNWAEESEHTSTEPVNESLAKDEKPNGHESNGVAKTTALSSEAEELTKRKVS